MICIAIDADTRPVITRESSVGFPETMGRLKEAILQRGLTVFATIDHSGAAQGAGLQLPPEQVLIFGNPKTGTPLMQADPRVGYELPLRMLVWQEGDRVLLGYGDPRELAGEYELAAQASILDRMAALLSDLAAEAGA